MEELVQLFTETSWEFYIRLFIQVVIISYVLAWSWQRIVGSQAERLVKGVLMIAAIWALAYALHFSLITSLLQAIVPVAVMALVIIFQPELRRGLGHLGRMQTFHLDWSLKDADTVRTQRDVEQIIAAVRELSRSKTGALIVIEPRQGERDYVSPGTTVNADITTTLLLTIFFPNSPLHDGAVVIRENKVVAAGVILPMTDDPQLSYRYGTRHRAAIGLSETYDGLCIVVSEETGAISAASRGMLARYKTADDLRNPIMYLYTQGGDSKSPNPLSNFLSLFSRGAHELVGHSHKKDEESEPSGETKAEGDGPEAGSGDAGKGGELARDGEAGESEGASIRESGVREQSPKAAEKKGEAEKGSPKQAKETAETAGESAADAKARKQLKTSGKLSTSKEPPSGERAVPGSEASWSDASARDKATDEEGGGRGGVVPLRKKDVEESVGSGGA